MKVRKRAVCGGECQYQCPQGGDPLIEESLELTRMMGASVATARRKLEQEGDMEI